MASAQPRAFADSLRRYRVAAGLTQEELAERAGLSRRAIGALETGSRRAPHKETISLLAAALGLTAAERALLESAARQRLASSDVGTTAVYADPTGGRSTRWPSAMMPPRAPLVGRRQELTALGRHLAGEGPPVLLLAGEPGIGKSRLLIEAADRASTQGWMVLADGCYRHSSQEPFAPIVGALIRLLSTRSPVQQRLDLQGCAWLVRLLPELAEQVLVPTPSWTLPADHERRLMFAAVARFLANVAGPAGTLLVLDDLQWAGADALDLLTVLIHSPTSTAPLRVLGAYRTTEVHPPDSWGVALADLAAAGLATQHQLGPLSKQEAKSLLQHMLVGQKVPFPSTARTKQVLTRSGGVPFFLVSCAEVLRDETLASNEAVPWTVAHSIRQRVAALPKAAQRVLRVAAVIGRQTDRILLFAVLAQLGQTKRLTLAALEATNHAHLLVEAGEDAYQFPHDLIREVIATDLSAARRAHLHQLIAEALEAIPGEPPVERLAYHYQRAGRAGKAIHLMEQAGDQAWTVHANAAAEGCYRDVLTRLVGLGRPLDEARVAEKLAKALRVQGQYEQALKLFQQAADAYLRGADREMQWGVVVEMGWLYFRRGMSAEGLAHLRALLPAAEHSASVHQMVAILTLLAAHERNTGQHRAALKSAARAVELARGGDMLPQAGPSPAVSYGRLLLDEGRVEEALQLIEEVLPLAERTGDLTNLASCLRIPAAGYLLRGEFAKSRVYRERTLRIVERTGDRGYGMFQLSARGRLSFLSGDWPAARADAERAVSLYRQIGAADVHPQPVLLLGELSLAEGRWEMARALLVEGLVRAEQMGESERVVLAHAAFAEWELLGGQPWAVWERLVPLLGRPDREEIFLTQPWTLLAWAAADLGKREQAELWLQQALQRARAHHLSFALVDPLRVQARLALQQERWADAQAALEESLAMCRRMPYPYAEAKALHVYGQLHAAEGDPERAREKYQASLAILSRLGERLYAEQIERALAALGHTPRS